MAADIEFNVRNGMTVGSNKHLVLDVNGALSGSDITCTTGTILSGGSDLRDLFDLSDIETLLAANSGNWNTAYGWDDHSTQNYATSAYVDYKVSNLVDGAPAALDTLNELAAALGDDANFSTTVTTAIDTKWTKDNTKISNWDSTYASVVGTSATWDSVYAYVLATSGDWNTAYGWDDHSTQNYATSAYVDYKVSSLVDSAPAALDTLNELAAALGDDANFSTTVTTAIGTKWTPDNTKISNWDSTYTTVSSSSASWDHSSAGYLTSYTETDPIFSAHAASNVTTQKISDWDSTYTTVSSSSASWDHSGAGYLTSETNTTLTLAGDTDTLTYTDEEGSQNSISLSAYTGEGISSIVDATDTDISTPLAGDALVYVNGVTQKWQNKKDRAALDDMYNYANVNFYSEMSYSTTAQLTGVNVWVNNSKTTTLFERTLTYNVNSQLTSVITRDIQGGTIRQQLTKNLAYDVDGKVATVTRAYSEPAQWIPTNSSSVLWLDAADSDTITKDGSNLVSEWQDKSGNDNHVVQSNAAVKPAYTASGMSGNPAIDFSTDKVATINDIDMEDKMLLLAFQLDAAGLGRNQQLFASNTDNAQLRMTTTDGNDVIGYASSSPLYTNNTKSTGTVAGDTIEVICYTLGSTLRFSINGTFEDSEQSKLTGGNLLSTFNQIGTLLSNTNTSLDGKIGEFIVINSTSTSDRQKAEGYLAHKWGVASKLPADHPWKSYPPVV
jgi:hypothetical protein